MQPSFHFIYSKVDFLSSFARDKVEPITASTVTHGNSYTAMQHNGGSPALINKAHKNCSAILPLRTQLAVKWEHFTPVHDACKRALEVCSILSTSTGLSFSSIYLLENYYTVCALQLFQWDYCSRWNIILLFLLSDPSICCGCTDANMPN